MQVVLFDVQQRTAAGELSCPFLKYAVWSADMSQVALLSKHAIIIADKRLQNATTGVQSYFVCVTLPSPPSSFLPPKAEDCCCLFRRMRLWHANFVSPVPR